MLVGGDITPPCSSTGGHRRQDFRHAAHLQDAHFAISLDVPTFSAPSRRAKSVAEPKVLMPIFLPRKSSGFIDSFDRDDRKKG